MTLLSSFEILAENLVPTGIIPAGPGNPFLIQGYFVQVSLSPDAGFNPVSFNLIFQETTNFAQNAANSTLMAQIIDANGIVNTYDDFFSSTARGFLGQKIGPGQTVIYGVQVFPAVATTTEAVQLPQAGTGWRGTVQLVSNNPGALIATPTARLVYYENLPPNGPILDAVVYPVPTASGGTLI